MPHEDKDRDQSDASELLKTARNPQMPGGKPETDPLSQPSEQTNRVGTFISDL